MVSLSNAVAKSFPLGDHATKFIALRGCVGVRGYPNVMGSDE